MKEGSSLFKWLSGRPSSGPAGRREASLKTGQVGGHLVQIGQLEFGLRSGPRGTGDVVSLIQVR